MRLPHMVWGTVFPPPQPPTAPIPTASKQTIILRPRHGAPNRTVAFSPPRCFESADFVIFMTSNPLWWIAAGDRLGPTMESGPHGGLKKRSIGQAHGRSGNRKVQGSNPWSGAKSDFDFGSRARVDA